MNGLRAVVKKGFKTFLEHEKPDILGIQETKLQPHQVPEELNELGEYRVHWNSAERKGYSGVGVFSRIDPEQTVLSFDDEILDGEGRIIQMVYRKFTLFNIYFPNGQMNEERLTFKLKFYDRCLDFFNLLRKKGQSVIVMGDFNTAHREIDLANPKSNEDRSGFLPVEREWIDKLIDAGYVDTFRLFHPEPDQYTWWTYRFNARQNNVGWRIDYFFVSDDLKDSVVDSYILPDVYGSDHCPIGLTIKI